MSRITISVELDNDTEFEVTLGGPGRAAVHHASQAVQLLDRAVEDAKRWLAPRLEAERRSRGEDSDGERG